MKAILYNQLIHYQNKNIYPFHMPGHKRKMENNIINPYQLDITEITDFDNLNDPQGILKESMKQATEFYGTKRTFYLVNGSTSGLLAAITAVCHYGDKILMARNCHKAVYNAVRILGLVPVYLPLIEAKDKNIYTGIQEEILKELLRTNQGIKAVLITSPTYEGIIMHIESIKMCITPYKIPLIVDEAHGAHFPYFNKFPKSAIACGADIVIQSIHKMMPSFTQTALLHLCSDLVKPNNMQDCISIYQSSSPSYLLMMGIEYAITYGSSCKEEFQQYFSLLKKYRKKFQNFSHIHLLDKEDIKAFGAFDLDLCKFVFFFYDTERTGEEISQWMLKKYKIELEMAERDYIIAITTVMDKEEGFEQLYQALKTLDLEIEEEQHNKKLVQREENQKKNQIENKKRKKEKIKGKTVNIGIDSFEIYCKPSDAVQQKKQWINLEDAKGKVCGEYIYIYPPGIPLLVAGEVIKEKDISLIENYLECGFYVKGIALLEKKNMIEVLELEGNDNEQ